MSRDAEFLQAIIASPADDAPRLVYADWLEERGDAARAEFIRLQCELARLPLSDRRVSSMRERERQLLESHLQTWLGLIQNLLLFWRFRRGFLEEVSVDAEIFLTYGQSLLEAAPIRYIHFCNIGTRITDLADLKFLGKAASLDFRNNMLGDSEVRFLVKSPHLLRVKTLGLASNGLQDESVIAISESSSLATLTQLDLANNHITDACLSALIRSPYLARLERLNLRNNLIFESHHPLRARFGDGVEFS